MEEKPKKHFPSSKLSILGLFAMVTFVLTVPLIVLLAQEPQDIRQKASELTPTDAMPPQTQGAGLLSGYVYLDVNKNGERDIQELPLPGVTVQLTDLPTTTEGVTPAETDKKISISKTDAYGYFSFKFTNLFPQIGSYMIKLDLPDGFKTINTNPIVLLNQQNDIKEIVQFGVFPISSASAIPVPTGFNSTCLPRPPCLDRTPRCTLPEPPMGWCPATTPSVSTTPDLTSCTQRPWCLDHAPRCKIPQPKNGWCPAPTPTQTASQSGVYRFGD